MDPEFHDGDIIVINPYLKQEHNDYVVVCNEEGEATFKQLKKYGKIRVLHPLNTKFDDIELSRNVEYRIVWVVLEKKKEKEKVQIRNKPEANKSFENPCDI